ncbi:MAG TPA: hypothetical protein VKS79_25965 [Gemmataceae bacterium]|nr:hypothetical protein [Gemmataceae bacterium]
MDTQKIRLVDADRKPLASAEVTHKDEYYAGTIDFRNTPSSVRSLFEEFEEIIHGQMFSLLDDIEEKIAALRLKASFDNNGALVEIRDLQIFPRTGKISFKAAAPVTFASGAPDVRH